MGFGLLVKSIVISGTPKVPLVPKLLDYKIKKGINRKLIFISYICFSFISVPKPKHSVSILLCDN